jgi:hypothetical protein
MIGALTMRNELLRETGAGIGGEPPCGPAEVETTGRTLPPSRSRRYGVWMVAAEEELRPGADDSHPG